MDAYEVIERFDPPGRYEIAENPIACVLTIVAEDENVFDWTQASEEQITTALNERGIYHAVEVVRPRTVAASPEEETEIWQTALGQLKLQMTDATFDAWLRNSTLVSRENDKIVVAVKSECARDWLTHRLRATIERTLARLAGHHMNIEFAVSRPGS
jgi:hypothetical protein